MKPQRIDSQPELQNFLGFAESQDITRNLIWSGYCGRLLPSKSETAKADTADEDDDWLDDQEPPAERKEGEAGGQAVQQLAVANARAINLLSSLRKAAWIIVALLLLILIR